MLGELVPKGGGDPIPLLKNVLQVGRRESCDIVLRFGNVSAVHCELKLESGYWFVKDLNSRNGTRVNGYRVSRRRLDPGDVLSLAKLQYEVNYSPAELGAVGPPPDGGDLEDILSQSLMDSAGLNRKTAQQRDGRIGRGLSKRPPVDDGVDEPGEPDDDSPEEDSAASATETDSEEEA